MKSVKIVRVEAPTLGDESGQRLGFWPRYSCYSGANVIGYWELRPEGRTVLSALIQCISRDRN